MNKMWLDDEPNDFDDLQARLWEITKGRQTSNRSGPQSVARTTHDRASSSSHAPERETKDTSSETAPTVTTPTQPTADLPTSDNRSNNPTTQLQTPAIGATQGSWAVKEEPKAPVGAERYATLEPSNTVRLQSQPQLQKKQEVKAEPALRQDKEKRNTSAGRSVSFLDDLEDAETKPTEKAQKEPILLSKPGAHKDIPGDRDAPLPRWPRRAIAPEEKSFEETHSFCKECNLGYATDQTNPAQAHGGRQAQCCPKCAGLQQPAKFQKGNEETMQDDKEVQRDQAEEDKSKKGQEREVTKDQIEKAAEKIEAHDDDTAGKSQNKRKLSQTRSISTAKAGRNRSESRDTDRIRETEPQQRETNKQAASVNHMTEITKEKADNERWVGGVWTEGTTAEMVTRGQCPYTHPTQRAHTHPCTRWIMPPPISPPDRKPKESTRQKTQSPGNQETSPPVEWDQDHDNPSHRSTSDASSTKEPYVTTTCTGTSKLRLTLMAAHSKCGAAKEPPADTWNRSRMCGPIHLPLLMKYGCTAGNSSSSAYASVSKSPSAMVCQDGTSQRGTTNDTEAPEVGARPNYKKETKPTEKSTARSKRPGSTGESCSTGACASHSEQPPSVSRATHSTQHAATSTTNAKVTQTHNKGQRTCVPDASHETKTRTLWTPRGRETPSEGVTPERRQQNQYLLERRSVGPPPTGRKSVLPTKYGPTQHGNARKAPPLPTMTKSTKGQACSTSPFKTKEWSSNRKTPTTQSRSSSCQHTVHPGQAHYKAQNSTLSKHCTKGAWMAISARISSTKESAHVECCAKGATSNEARPTESTFRTRCQGSPAKSQKTQKESSRSQRRPMTDHRGNKPAPTQQHTGSSPSKTVRESSTQATHDRLHTPRRQHFSGRTSRTCQVNPTCFSKQMQEARRASRCAAGTSGTGKQIQSPRQGKDERMNQERAPPAEDHETTNSTNVTKETATDKDQQKTLHWGQEERQEQLPIPPKTSKQRKSKYSGPLNTSLHWGGTESSPKKKGPVNKDLWQPRRIIAGQQKPPQRAQLRCLQQPRRLSIAAAPSEQLEEGFAVTRQTIPPLPRSHVDNCLLKFLQTKRQTQTKKAKYSQREDQKQKVRATTATIPFFAETNHSQSNDAKHIDIPNYKWLRQPKTLDERQRTAALLRLRPPAFGPKDAKEKHYAVADQLWSKLFHLIPGTTSRTAAILATQNPDKGKEVLRKVLRNRNPKGLATHARSVLAYHAWHKARWPDLPWLPQQKYPGTRDLYCAILVDFLEDIMDADVSPGVPKSKLTSLNVAIRMCRPNVAWPTDETIVINMTQTYYREGKHKKRLTRLYTLAEIQLMKKAMDSNGIGKPRGAGGPELGPLERIAIATELRKVYARLRQDDATWGRMSEWKIVENTSTNGDTTTHWHGIASKAKGTEMRANWVHENMPWIAPTRGLCAHTTPWHNQILNDMITIGMRPTDDYLLPSPAAVRAGRRPPGATDHLEWINLVRNTLKRIGFEPHQAATICGHTAKRTMLTWLNASGMVRSDQDQQAAGYHRAKGPGSVSRKYTLHEQAGPVRTIDALCKAIRQGDFHPDRPVGAEWDETCVIHQPDWQITRLPNFNPQEKGKNMQTE